MIALGGVVTLVVVVGVLLVMFAMYNGTSVLDLEPGDCFVLPIDGDDLSVDSVDLVDCDEPHRAEAVLVGSLNPDRDREYPDDDALFDEVDERCALVVREISPEFGMLPVAPNEASWEPLGGRFVCVAIPFGGGQVTGSITPDLET